MIPREKYITYIKTINKIQIRYNAKIRQYICKAIGGKPEYFTHRKDAENWCKAHKLGATNAKA
jgi:hypothetical protein